MRFLLAILTVLAAFAVRLLELAVASVWYDEGWSVWLARMGFRAAAKATSRDSHPPLYFWLLHLWMLPAGDSEFSTRWLSVAAGVLTVAILIRIGWNLSNSTTGLAAGSILTLSVLHVWWSQEIRMYALAVLFASLVLLVVSRSAKIRAEVMLIAIPTGLGFYSLYVALATLPGQGLYLLFYGRQRLWRWLAGLTVAGLTALPWAYFAARRMPTWSAGQSPTVADYTLAFLMTSALGISTDLQRQVLWAALVASILALCCLGWLTVQESSARQQWRRAGIFAGCWLLSAYLVTLVAVLPRPFFYSPVLTPRYFVIATPGVALAAAAAIGALWSWQRTMALLALVFVLGVESRTLYPYFANRTGVDDAASLAKVIETDERPGDAILLDTNVGWPVFDYHYRGHAAVDGISSTWVNDPVSIRKRVDSVVAAHARVWLVIDPLALSVDPEHVVEVTLAQKKVRLLNERFGDRILALYTPAGSAPPRAESLASFHPDILRNQRLSANLTLQGFDVPVRRIGQGSPLFLGVYWSKQGTTPVGPVQALLTPASGERPVAALEPLPAAALWTSGEVRQEIAFGPLAVPAGQYTLRITPPGGRSVRLTIIDIVGTDQAPQPTITGPPPVHQVGDRFGRSIELVGFTSTPDMGGKLARGVAFHLDLVWRADSPVRNNWKVFTHLSDGGTGPSSIWGQQDNEPVGGTRPTSTWKVSETIHDDYTLTLKPGAPKRAYQIDIGMYDPLTGRRAIIRDHSDQVLGGHLVLGTISN